MLSGPAKSNMVTSRKRLSLVNSTNTPLWLSMKLFLILAVILGTYPQAASACPTQTAEVPRGDVWQSQRTHAHSSSLDLQPESTQLLIMQRNESNGSEKGKLARRDPLNIISIITSIMGDLGNGDGNGGGNGDGNGDGHQETTTSTPRILVGTTTTSTARATSSPITTAAPPPPPTTTAATSYSQSTPAPGGTDNNQASGGSEEAFATGTQLSGSGANATQPSSSPSRPSQTGQAVPNQPHNGSSNDPGYTMTLSVGAGGGGNYQSGNRINNGLLAGLVVSLIILVALCALAAFFVVRRIRRNRQKQQASPYNDTAPCIASSKTGLIEEAYDTEKAESGDPCASPRQSIESEPRLRARTPGGSSAIPIPYNPSEISDDVSSHFTFLSRDEAIGVPVPYPLALHVPARVANAMAERDARWKQSDDLRRLAYRSSSNMSGQTHDDLRTIPDPSLRRNTRQSTTESLMSSSEGGYYTLAHRHSTPPDSFASRSDAGMDAYTVEGLDRRSTLGSDMSDHMMVSAAEFPIPPLPLPARIHGAQSSTRMSRRVSAAPSVGTLYSPRLYSVSENPFATNTEVNSVDAAAAASEEGTTTHHSSDESRRLSAPTAIGGVAERVTLRTSLARRSLLVQSALRNPFDDEHAPEDSQSDRQA